jgi:ferrochelatase
MPKVAVLLTVLGTPESPTPTSIRHFLKEFLSDSRVVELPRWLWLPILYGIILLFRPYKLAKQYQKIWTPAGSPLRVISQQQVYALQESLDISHPGLFQVELTQCYGQPNFQTVATRLQAIGITKWLVFPLYPQYSATTTAAILDQCFAYLQKLRNLPQVRWIHEYARAPLYIAAIKNQVENYWAMEGRGAKLLFSFHGIPVRNVERGDPYREACYHTAELCAHALDLKPDEWCLSFQSRFGYAKWLTPFTDVTLRNFPAQGVKKVVVLAPGFAADCLETLEELAEFNRHIFLAAGGEQYDYIPALNTSAGHIAHLTDQVLMNTAGWIS